MVTTSITWIENGGKLAVACPSLTLIVMLAYTPASPLPGVPNSAPVAVLKLAQAGRLLMLNVKLSPSASLASGVKLYALSASTALAGVPEIVGAVFVTISMTSIENGVRLAEAWPSLTLIVTFA